MRQKKRKKTESIQEKKILNARKKVKHSGMWKTKGGFPCFVGGTAMFKKLQSNDVCHRLETKRQQPGEKCRDILLPIRREIIDENKGEQMSEDNHADI